MVKAEVKRRIECSHCGPDKIYRHGMCRSREVHLSFTGAAETVVTASVPSLKTVIQCGHVPS